MNMMLMKIQFKGISSNHGLPLIGKNFRQPIESDFDVVRKETMTTQMHRNQLIRFGMTLFGVTGDRMAFSNTMHPTGWVAPLCQFVVIV